MTDIQLPPESEPLHRSIAQKAAENLGRLVEGNGLKAEQIRLSREETHIHRIPAAIAVRLAAEVTKTRVRGRAPQGIMVATAGDVAAAAESHGREALKEDGIQREISEALKKDAGQGFGMDQATFSLSSQQKDFSVITTCPKCGGGAMVTCARCNGSGNTACTACQGGGSSSCQWCRGSARLQDPQGNFMPCTHCQNGRIPCQTCRGYRSITCNNCRGQGRSPCTECGQTGFFTEIYKIGHKAQCTFDIDWRETPPEVKAAAHKLGLRELATQKHAEILWQFPEARPDELVISCAAFLPIAQAEFLATEGRTYPALVAGLRGRIIEIDPVLDKYVKPGISALMKLSKGPMARQALIDTACKYRLIRQVLAGLARSSRKNVYQWLGKNYPLMLSDKYARATVKYAAVAMASLSTGPRHKGLAAGTGLAGLLAMAYYLTPLRRFLLVQMAQHYIGQYMFVMDIAVWLAGWGIAVYAIRIMTAYSLGKMLPGSVSAKALPAAGPQGLMALPAAGLVCCIIAATAAEKPEWIQYILQLRGL